MCVCLKDVFQMLPACGRRHVVFFLFVEFVKSRQKYVVDGILGWQPICTVRDRSTARVGKLALPPRYIGLFCVFFYTFVYQNNVLLICCISNE